MSEDTTQVEPEEPEVVSGIGSAGAPAPVVAKAEDPATTGVTVPQNTHNFEDPEMYTAFVNSLPEEVRERALLKNTKNIKSLAEQALNAESALGKKRLAAPSEDWTDDDWSNFYSQLRPETAEAYEAKEVLSVSTEDGTPMDYTFDPDTTALLKEAAFDIGATPKGFEALQKKWAEHAATSERMLDQQINEAVEGHVNSLREEWGSDYPVKYKEANEAFSTLSQIVPELNEFVEWSPIVANHPAVMKLFQTLSPLVQNLGGDVSGVAGSFGADTVASTKAQLADLDAQHKDLIFPKDIAALSIAEKTKREQILAQRTELYKKMYS